MNKSYLFQILFNKLSGIYMYIFRNIRRGKTHNTNILIQILCPNWNIFSNGGVRLGDLTPPKRTPLISNILKLNRYWIGINGLENVKLTLNIIYYLVKNLLKDLQSLFKNKRITADVRTNFYNDWVIWVFYHSCYYYKIGIYL